MVVPYSMKAIVYRTYKARVVVWEINDDNESVIPGRALLKNNAFEPNYFLARSWNSPCELVHGPQAAVC